MGDALAHVGEARARYVGFYREVIRKRREEDPACAVEVWVETGRRPEEAPDDAAAPPGPLCIDILCGAEGGERQMIMVAQDVEPPRGPLAAVLDVGGVEARVYALAWETCIVWARCPEGPDSSGLDAWRGKWLGPDRGEPSPEDAAVGLHGCVHYVGPPAAEGGGDYFDVDFGSAPVHALVELLEALVAMGAREIEVGRSDGTDIDAEVARELARPDLAEGRLTELLATLLARLPEVEAVELAGPQEVRVKARRDEGAHSVYTGNLFLRLQRVGPEARVPEVWRFVRGERDAMRGGDVPPDLSQLRPVIKDDRFLEGLPTHADGSRLAVLARRLAGDLWVCCVWDSAHGMRFTLEDEPGTYGLSADEMHARALANYLEDRKRGGGEVELTEHGPLLVARTGDSYDATLLLDDGFWDEVAAKVKGPVLACAPARDLVLIGGAKGKGVARAMRQAAARVSAGGDHLVSETILVREGGAWRVHAGEAEAEARPWWRFW